MFELMQKLCGVLAPSGREYAITEVIRDMVAPYVDEVKVDVLGNVVGRQNRKIGSNGAHSVRTDRSANFENFFLLRHADRVEIVRTLFCNSILLPGKAMRFIAQGLRLSHKLVLKIIDNSLYPEVPLTGEYWPFNATMKD